MPSQASYLVCPSISHSMPSVTRGKRPFAPSHGGHYVGLYVVFSVFQYTLVLDCTYGYIHMVYELSDSASPYHITMYHSISGITAMHLTEAAPVTQIRPLRPVAAAVQFWVCSSAVLTPELV